MGVEDIYPEFLCQSVHIRGTSILPLITLIYTDMLRIYANPWDLWDIIAHWYSVLLKRFGLFDLSVNLHHARAELLRPDFNALILQVRIIGITIRQRIAHLSMYFPKM